MKSTSLRRIAAIVLLLSLVTTTPACIGNFNLTRQVHHFNSNVGAKWVNEIIFLGFVIVPVYGVCIVGDGIIFNSFEFWGGTNPVSAPGGSKE